MKKILLVILGLITILGVVLIMNQKKEDPVLEDTDTGFTRFQTEELMREIGYVQ